jgi:hypothetical protein
MLHEKVLVSQDFPYTFSKNPHPRVLLTAKAHLITLCVSWLISLLPNLRPSAFICGYLWFQSFFARICLALAGRIGKIDRVFGSYSAHD